MTVSPGLRRSWEECLATLRGMLATLNVNQPMLSANNDTPYRYPCSSPDYGSPMHSSNKKLLLMFMLVYINKTHVLCKHVKAISLRHEVKLSAGLCFIYLFCHKNCIIMFIKLKMAMVLRMFSVSVILVFHYVNKSEETKQMSSLRPLTKSFSSCLPASPAPTILLACTEYNPLKASNTSHHV